MATTTHTFCPGYAKSPWKKLVQSYPADDVYPSNSFRTEWGPIFHRGRLDGTARVLVIGQDPAQHETVARRILVGEAGQRFQGFLSKLGIDRSYVLVNTFLYSVYGQGGGQKHIKDQLITDYRNRWLDAIASHNQLEAVVTLGTLADTAYHAWPGATGASWKYATVLHPTYPDSASASGQITKKAATKRLCENWNTALDLFSKAPGAVTPDTPRELVHYGDAITPAEHTLIIEEDLPPGLPAWMRGLQGWARRTGTTAADKRVTITITIPKNARPTP
jgi:uracil-DNA glycosylase